MQLNWLLSIFCYHKNCVQGNIIERRVGEIWYLKFCVQFAFFQKSGPYNGKYDVHSKWRHDFFLFLAPICNMPDLTGSNGTFTSPNFPNGYSNNLWCVYNITVPQGKYVVLNVNQFQLESCCDWLRVSNWILLKNTSQYDRKRNFYVIFIYKMKCKRFCFGLKYIQSKNNYRYWFS